MKKKTDKCIIKNISIINENDKKDFKILSNIMSLESALLSKEIPNYFTIEYPEIK